MSSKEELICLIQNSENPAKLIAILNEVIKMIRQGKNDDEIKKHFGLA